MLSCSSRLPKDKAAAACCLRRSCAAAAAAAAAAGPTSRSWVRAALLFVLVWFVSCSLLISIICWGGFFGCRLGGRNPHGPTGPTGACKKHHEPIQSELETNRKRKEEVVTPRKNPKTTQTYNVIFSATCLSCLFRSQAVSSPVISSGPMQYPPLLHTPTRCVTSPGAALGCVARCAERRTSPRTRAHVLLRAWPRVQDAPTESFETSLGIHLSVRPAPCSVS